jgi:polyhydroxyalkanoate synthesis regulator phasin
MSVKTLIGPWPSFGRRSLVFATLAIATSGLATHVVAQEPAAKSVGERIKESWEKLIAKMEASAKAAGDEYHKLKDEAAKESGPARAKLAAEMEHISKKWAIAREKLATSIELRMNSLHDEIHELEEKTDKATGPTRAKMTAEMHKLHEEWTAARAKMEATLSANLKSSREEIEHLKEHASTAASDAKAKVAPRLERLKAEFHKDRDKLSAYLESDLEQTKADMKKLGEATTSAAASAKEKLMKKYHELTAKHEELAKEKAADEAN